MMNGMVNGTGMMVWGVFSFLLGLFLIFLFVVVVAAAVKWWGQQTRFGIGSKESAYCGCGEQGPRATLLVISRTTRRRKNQYSIA